MAAQPQFLAISAVPALPAPPAQLMLPPPSQVSEAEFTHLVRTALEAVGGNMLFSVRLDGGDAREHVAAASVGNGVNRQFLLLSLPLSGGSLKVEIAARSASPLARIAASYAGLMDAFKVAA